MPIKGKWKMKKYIKPINVITLFAVVVSLIAVLTASQVGVSEEIHMDNDSDRTVKQVDAVKIYNSKGEVFYATVQERLAQGEYYIYLNEKNINMYTPIYIKISSVNTTLRLSADGETLFVNDNEPRLKNLGYPSVNLIKMPNKYSGQDVKLSFQSAFDNSGYTNIPRIQIGTKRALIADAQKNDLFELVLGIVIFMIGDLTLFAAIILYRVKADYYQIFYVSIFSTIISVVIIVNTDLVKMLFPESTVFYYGYYILFSVLPIPLLLMSYDQLTKNDAGKWRREMMRYIYYIEVVVVLLALLAVVKNNKAPINIHTFIIVNIALGSISIGLSIITLDIKIHKIKPILVLSMLPVFLIYLENLELYLGIKESANSVRYTPIYALIFLSIYFYISLNTYFKSYKNLEMTKYYERIAFVDSLTGVGTRHALENDIEIIQEKKLRKIIIMFIDVNYMKRINDESGHDVGDKVLKALGKLIIEVESTYKYVKGYRFGGDEFIIIINKPKPKVAENIKRFLKDSADKIRNSSEELPLSLAVAYDETVVEKNMDIDYIIKNADKKMYKDKANKALA